MVVRIFRGVILFWGLVALSLTAIFGYMFSDVLTERAVAQDWSPVWSPDSAWIAFISSRDQFEGQDLYRMRADGTDVQRLTTTGDIGGGIVWSADSEWIVFEARNTFYRVGIDGTGLEQLTARGGHFWPTLSPDGAWILYTTYGGGTDDLYLMRPDGSEQQALLAAPEDQSDGVWSPNGAWIVYRSAERPYQPGDLYRVQADGSDPQRLTDTPAQYRGVCWSPDSEYIVFASDQDGDWDIYRLEADGSGLEQLTGDNPLDDLNPIWSPDSAPDANWIVFEADDRTRNRDLYRMRPDGSELERLTGSRGWDYDASWSPDGAWILFVSERNGDKYIYRMRPDGSDEQRLTHNERGVLQELRRLLD